mmetsp:Transcript_10782/g.34568  ORF Transcript_10782/g.34568 Transcript_10782/m.34568 type:complete len:358 (+) Transcript_10782:51-1124(+)
MSNDDRINRSMWPIEYRKPHDVSFDKKKTMMRTVTTSGSGDDARDGSVVRLHFSVHAPEEEGGERLIFDSASVQPGGVSFTLGETLHAEVLERAVLGLPPGSVADVICTDAAAASDSLLRIEPPPLGPLATETVTAVQRKQFSEQIGASFIEEKNAEVLAEAKAWRPPATMTRWNVRLDSATAGVVPAFITYPPERLDWSTRQKEFGAVLFGKGQHARAGRRYKKALLDLEVPTQWTEETNIERNKLRLALHLNIAACALRTADYDNAVFHATRALRTDPKNVKALFRRASAHLAKAGDVNGLEAALADLGRARELDPDNRDVVAKLAEARRRQKAADRDAASVFSKMVQPAEAIYS